MQPLIGFLASASYFNKVCNVLYRRDGSCTRGLVDSRSLLAKTDKEEDESMLQLAAGRVHQPVPASSHYS